MTEKSARHGGDVFGLSAAEQEKVLDFSININPLGLSPLGKEALLRSWEREALRYPDVECRGLLAAISTRYGVPTDTIALGNGATELMYKLLSLLKPLKVLVPAPSFSEYHLSAEAAGCEVESFLLHKENGFRLPLKEIRRKMTAHSLLYLGHPNNPDGQLLHEDDFRAVMAMAEEKDAFVIIDESFIDFAPEGISYRNELVRSSHGAAVMSLTKFYAVPGLRIGCAFMAPALCEKLKSTLIPWNVNGLAQLYMTAALSDAAYQAETVAYNQARRRELASGLSAISDIEILPGSVNFILCRLTGTFETAKALQDALFPYHIFIRQCGNYEGLDDSYFRVAVRPPEENEKLLAALRDVFTKDGPSL